MPRSQMSSAFQHYKKQPKTSYSEAACRAIEFYIEAHKTGKLMGPKTDCPFYNDQTPGEPPKCNVLEQFVCRTKRCGFYPPEVERRKAEKK